MLYKYFHKTMKTGFVKAVLSNVNVDITIENGVVVGEAAGATMLPKRSFENAIFVLALLRDHSHVGHIV